MIGRNEPLFETIDMALQYFTEMFYSHKFDVIGVGVRSAAYAQALIIVISSYLASHRGTVVRRFPPGWSTPLYTLPLCLVAGLVQGQQSGLYSLHTFTAVRLALLTHASIWFAHELRGKPWTTVHGWTVYGIAFYRSPSDLGDTWISRNIGQTVACLIGLIFPLANVDSTRKSYLQRLSDYVVWVSIFSIPVRKEASLFSKLCPRFLPLCNVITGDNGTFLFSAFACYLFEEVLAVEVAWEESTGLNLVTDGWDWWQIVPLVTLAPALRGFLVEILCLLQKGSRPVENVPMKKESKGHLGVSTPKISSPADHPIPSQ